MGAERGSVAALYASPTLHTQPRSDPGPVYALFDISHGRAEAVHVALTIRVHDSYSCETHSSLPCPTRRPWKRDTRVARSFIERPWDGGSKGERIWGSGYYKRSGQKESKDEKHGARAGT